MPRLDHITIPVADWQKARDFYVRYLGLEVEFESLELKTAALKDGADLALFVEQHTGPADRRIAFAIQVDDVEASYRSLSAAGLVFEHAPSKLFWGYGAELRDPDGYLIRLWDPVSMKAKG